MTISAVIPVVIDGSHAPRCWCTGLRQFEHHRGSCRALAEAVFSIRYSYTMRSSGGRCWSAGASVVMLVPSQ
jgi:hypothetical protein